MAPYVLLYFFSIALLILSARFKLNHLYFFVAILFSLFSSIRDNIGVDYHEYSSLFPLVVSGLNTQFEIANILLIKFFYNIGGEHAVFSVYSISTIFLVFYALKVISPSKEISLLIFLFFTVFYLATLNHIRQWLAISLVMTAYAYLIQGKFRLSIIFAVIAPLFHLSIVYLSFVLFLLRFKVKEKYFNIIVFGGVISSIFGIEILEYTKYRIYLSGFGEFHLIFLVFFIFSFIQFRIFKRLRYKIDSFRFYVLNSLLKILLSISFLVFYIGPSVLNGMRLIETLFWIELIVLPFLIKILKKEFRSLFYFCFVSILFFYNLIVLSFSGYYYKLTPFESFLM